MHVSPSIKSSPRIGGEPGRRLGEVKPHGGWSAAKGGGSAPGRLYPRPQWQGVTLPYALGEGLPEGWRKPPLDFGEAGVILLAARFHKIHQNYFVGHPFAN